MPKIYRESVGINYEVEGHGPVVMAISGLMSTLATSQFRLVPGLPDGFRLVYGEHRGAGNSDVPPGPYDIDQIADDWIAIMDAEDIERAPVLGNSMGSLIAQSMALRYPERVSLLVLSVPIGRADPFLIELTQHWLQTLISQGEKVFALQSLLWTLSTEGFNHLAPSVLPSLEKNLPIIDPAGFAGQIAAIASFDRRDELPKIRVPTLIIAAAEDRVCHPYHAGELASLIPNSRLVVIGQSGHLVQTEQPLEYARVLLPFLKTGQHEI